MVDSGSKFEAVNGIFALQRENELLAAELADLMQEEKCLLFEHSTAKAEYLSRKNKGGSALSSPIDLQRQDEREKVFLESASRVEYLIGNNMAPSYRVREDGRIIAGNYACARLLGYKQEQFYDGSLTVDQIVPPEMVAMETESLEDFKKGMIVTRTLVSERITAGGKRIPVACNFRLTKPDGSQWAAFMMDMSDTRALEEELKQRQALFSTLVQEMPNIVFLVCEDGTCWQFNRRFYEFTGKDPAEENGFFPTITAHPDDIAQNDERWKKALAEHQPLIGEVRVLADDGEYYWHVFRAIPLANPLPGQLEGLLQLARAVCPHAGKDVDVSKNKFWIGTSTDIDRRKRIIEDVLESAYNFQSLADQIPQIVWTAGPDGRIDFFNNRWFEFSGLDRDLKLGLDFALFIHADDRKNYVSTWKNCVRTGDAFDVEFRLKRKEPGTSAFSDGDYEKFLGRAVAVRNQRGEIEQWVGTWTSI